MSFREFTGKTVEEAIEKACKDLDAEQELLEINVLEQSTRGFLGIVGQKDARIEARKRDILKEVMEAGDSAEIEPKPNEVPIEHPPKHEPEETAETDVPASEPAPEQPKEMRFTGDDPLETEARTILEDILGRMEVVATVQSKMENGAVHLDIIGDGSGLLIGKKGQTLDALQYLVNKIINKANTPQERTDVVVDTENYRSRSQEKLRDMAVKLSTKAKRTLKPVSFNPMPSHERRIVHLVLSEDREVYTKSYGDGPMRRIIVYPRRGGSNRRRGR
jgi:spoIIIJ-associated protein